jgi:hypothetical protein
MSTTTKIFAWCILFSCVAGIQVHAQPPLPPLRPDHAAADDGIESLLNINYEQSTPSSYRNKLARHFERNNRMPHKLLCQRYKGSDYFSVNIFIFYQIINQNNF